MAEEELIGVEPIFPPISKITEDQVALLKQAMLYVPRNYYKLRTISEPDGIVRERVFCYELYHRMRCIQANEENSILAIHAEVDKRGSERFCGENPDFVFHQPGNMEDNTLVVEVKGKLDPSAVIGDINKLEKFITRYEYNAGVFVLYNHDLDEFVRRMRPDLKYKDAYRKITILCRKTFDSEIGEHRLSDICMQTPTL